jgi:hypothetical protein
MVALEEAHVLKKPEAPPQAPPKGQRPFGIPIENDGPTKLYSVG